METEEERTLIWFLLMNARWPTEEHVQLTEDAGLVEWISLQMEPEEPVPDQPFENIGSMSELYSRLYNDLTLSETGRVTSLTIRHDPGRMKQLINFKAKRLPIWQLIQQPS